MVPAPTAAYNSAADLAGTPTEIYLRSFGDYANGRYDAAILGFDAFLRNFPNNSYASNAQFWLADSYLKQQQLPRAIEEFNKLLQFYPNADKAPEALLKIATAQLQLDKPGQARETLETLRRRHPDSAAAQKAEKLVLP
jgi:tol-pal system protein YbgF